MRVRFLYIYLINEIQTNQTKSLLSIFLSYEANFSLSDQERTLILLKPDSIQRGLIGRIIQRFEDKGFKLIAMKFILVNDTIWIFHIQLIYIIEVWSLFFLQAPKDLVEKHYESHANSYYFTGLVEYMTSGPIIPIVLEGWNAVKLSRRMLGPPDTLESLPGTIRGDFSVHFGLSVVHGSHSIEEADREIPIWFADKELISWSQANKDWIQP